MRQLLRTLKSALDRDRSAIGHINIFRRKFAGLSDAQLRQAAMQANQLEFMALAAVASARVLGLEMYDAQLRGSLALMRGSIAEMQTGEGKTLAAVPAVAWMARPRKGIHVM